MGVSAVVVLTARGPKRLLDEGGSQAWRLNRYRAEEAEFLVCVQNQHNGAWGGATEPHGTAFLVGHISEIVPSPERPDRWLIKIKDYARVKTKTVWQGWHYPVRYMTLDELGVDPSSLHFEEMPDTENGAGLGATEQSSGAKLGDVIAAAKQKIAQAAGVAPEAIHIRVDLA